LDIDKKTHLACAKILFRFTARIGILNCSSAHKTLSLATVVTLRPILSLICLTEQLKYLHVFEVTQAGLLRKSVIETGIFTHRSVLEWHISMLIHLQSIKKAQLLLGLADRTAGIHSHCQHATTTVRLRYFKHFVACAQNVNVATYCRRLTVMQLNVAR